MTTKRQISAEIDGILRPLGFERQKDTWNRRDLSIVEVVDLEVGKSQGEFTLNAGVMDCDIHALVWGKPPEPFVDQPSCTVRARVGELVDGLDKWWPIADGTALVEIKKHVVQYLLPFLERTHSREGMRRWLVDTNVVKKRYPPPILSLAILCSTLGNPQEACEILRELKRKTTGAWQSTVAEISTKLSCDGPLSGAS